MLGRVRIDSTPFHLFDATGLLLEIMFEDALLYNKYLLRSSLGPLMGLETTDNTRSESVCLFTLLLEIAARIRICC